VVDILIYTRNLQEYIIEYRCNRAAVKAVACICTVDVMPGLPFIVMKRNVNGDSLADWSLSVKTSVTRSSRYLRDDQEPEIAISEPENASWKSCKPA